MIGIRQTDRMRVAINMGNSAIVQRAPTGDLVGKCPALADAIAKNMGLTVEFVVYESAGQILATVGSDDWDMAFLARDPLREHMLAFSEPYLKIEATCLVRAGPEIKRIIDLDRPSTKIAATRGAAYESALSKLLKNAELFRCATPSATLAAFLNGELEAAAGIRESLEAAAKGRSDLRVLRESFATIDQCVAVRRSAAADLDPINRVIAAILSWQVLRA